MLIALMHKVSIRLHSCMCILARDFVMCIHQLVLTVTHVPVLFLPDAQVCVSATLKFCCHIRPNMQVTYDQQIPLVASIVLNST